MNESNSKFIELESIPMKDLFKQPSETFGFYIPAPDENGDVSNSIARLSANAKAYGVKQNKKSVIESIIVMSDLVGKQLPSLSKMVKITVKSHDYISEKGSIYLQAQKAK
jgi:hypothetical protein